MKLFYWYLIKELGIIFLASCAFFLFLLTMENSFSLLKFGFNLKTIKIFLLFFPSVLGFALPMALLLSLIMGFGKQSNAIITMESSGISMRKTILFTIVFSLLLSFLAKAINGDISPKALFYLSFLTDELTKGNSLIKEKTFTKIGEREIYVDRIKDERLIDIYITEEEGKRIIFAKKGKMENIFLLLENGQIHELDQKDLTTYHIMKFSLLSIPIEKEKNIERTSIEHLTLGELKKREKNPYILTEFHKRLCISFAPFFLCLIAIPLGMRTRKHVRVFGLSASTIIILLYYLIFLGCEAFSKNGYISPLALWFPNAIFGLSGLIMLRRVLR